MMCRVCRPRKKEPDPQKMSLRRLKRRMCAAGPGYCVICRSCVWGVEWTARMQKRAERDARKKHRL